MSYRLRLITIFLVGVFLAGGSLWAKEDTAYLTFQKSAPSRPVITVYTVKKGEWLLDIGRRVTGETKHVYSIIRKYNPGIKDLNRIYPGQKVYLPSKAKTNVSSTDTSPVNAPPPSQRAGVLKDDMAYPAQIKWNLVKHVLDQIGATVTSQGKYYLPLRDMGQITIDCRKIPMVEFADKGTVFIDFRNQIPDNLRQLVRRTWKHYAIIKVNPQSEAPILLEKIIQASNTHAMIRQEQPLKIGSQPVLQIPASWTITRKSSTVTIPPHAIALWTRSEGTHGLPEPLKAYAETKGWKILELVQDRIVKPAPDNPILARPVSKLTSTSLIDLADDCFRRLGLQTQKNAELKIFDSARDGFDLRVEADLLVSKGEQRLIFLSKKMPDQFLNMLRNNGMEVILAMGGETKKSLLEKSFKALNIPCEFNTFSLPASEKTEMAGTYIVFPALKISMNNGKIIYLIDFDLDERMNGFLSEKMGLLVIKY
ncbi:MAG: LysM domain-containing protein [Deltaproteobacteria bacterium]|nr:LysM domain-containing protein [Deltaproteobacteria bacterium]